MNELIAYFEYLTTQQRQIVERIVYLRTMGIERAGRMTFSEQMELRKLIAKEFGLTFESDADKIINKLLANEVSEILNLWVAQARVRCNVPVQTITRVEVQVEPRRSNDLADTLAGIALGTLIGNARDRVRR